ncbi:hypothetical protein MKW92_013337 [Papaver armeniacum]|nr:hypothetical protein MKW92_013337 [Papaver armeniacum]
MKKMGYKYIASNLRLEHVADIICILFIKPVLVIFGLNTLNGTTVTRDHSATVPWDLKSSAALILCTVDKTMPFMVGILGNLVQTLPLSPTMIPQL